MPTPRRIMTPTLVAFVGCLIIAAGAWMVYPPAGVILFGMTLVLTAWVRIIAGPDDDDE